MTQQSTTTQPIFPIPSTALSTSTTAYLQASRSITGGLSSKVLLHSVHFDKKCGNHFTRPNRRAVQAIRTTQTPEEQQRDLQRISHLPEMQSVKRTFSIPEGQPETEENLDHLEARSTTRASGSTSFKRKSTEEPETKKHQASTILNFYNATINTHILIPMSTSPTMTPRKKDDSTVQSTPRTT
eukprot:4265934-Amphidinium_carterae.1